jgi:hypothetical protein
MEELGLPFHRGHAGDTIMSDILMDGEADFIVQSSYLQCDQMSRILRKGSQTV